MIPLYKFGAQSHSLTDWDRKYQAERVTEDSVALYGNQSFVQTTLKYLRGGQRLLDAGCGTGGLIRFLKQRGLNVSGIDTSAIAIATLRAAAPEIPVQVASVEVLPFPDAFFDAYAAIGSWEYLQNGPQQAAREAARVLKSHGWAFIEVPQTNVLRRLIYVPLKRLEVFVKRAVGKKPQFVHHLFSREEMNVLLREHFEILEIVPHDLPENDRHYGLWVDWPLLRGGPHYQLNALGRAVKALGNAVSPWTIATGMFLVAKKR